MKWPCMLGFRCPHLCYDDEGFEDVCIYPDLEPEEEKLYVFAVDWFICPLMDKGPLLDFLCEYEDNNRREA